MKNLGKILLLFILFPHAMLFAEVQATLNPKNITLGDMATLNLSISGKDIKQPQIRTICGVDVISTGTRTNIEMINGNYKKSYILSYQFSPLKDCEIKPIEVEIDGVIQKSNSISLKLKPVDRSKKADFILSLNTDKKNVLVGEAFDVTLLFKQKKDSGAVDSKFIAPELKGFWNKGQSKPIQFEDGDYLVTKVVFKIAAQRTGTLKISSAKMQIATRSNTRDLFGMWMQNIKWKTYFSNELNINVNPLPSGINLVGDFSISASVDKTTINANEALNVVVKIKGEGNLEDIKTLKPYVDNVNIFDEKIAIKNSELTQKMVFVADADFVVPPFSIKYYDAKAKKIKTISTKKIPIKVNGAKVKQKLTIKRQADVKKVQEAEVVKSSTNQFSYLWILLAFIIGLACGIMILIIKPWKNFSKEKSLDIKDYKMLLVKLLPFKGDEEVQKIVDVLEKNAYSKEKANIDKKVLKEIIKRYNIS
jgi:hypothetical protein